MSGPKTSYYDTECDICADLIQEGAPIWFNDDGRLCRRCADLAKVVCPECNGQKKPNFPTCFECRRGGWLDHATSASTWGSARRGAK
jgi:hypothetical protein